MAFLLYKFLQILVCLLIIDRSTEDSIFSWPKIVPKVLTRILNKQPETHSKNDTRFMINTAGITNVLMKPLPKLLGRLQTLPSPTQFLSVLFNVSVTRVSEYVNKFVFNTEEVSANDVLILLYKHGGKLFTYRLGDWIPLEPNQEIKIIIHGFRSEGFANWPKEIAESYHKIGFRNTIVIDWSKIANENYPTAASSTKNLGFRLAEWLFYKVLRGNPFHLRKVHLIGHSLGAHVCGFIGKKISRLFNGRYLIGRISGLDAAAPLFEFPLKFDSSLRLCKEDAYNVEAIHTNAGFFGFSGQYAHQDFYVSYGGPIQPGCIKWNAINSLICSHSLAYKIFRKTIVSQVYLATECRTSLMQFLNQCRKNRKVIVGEHTNGTSLRGSFYFKVDSDGNPKR